MRTTFTGSSIGWVTTVGPTMGQAAIYIDGASRPVQTLDLARSSAATRQIVWSHDFGAAGKHTIEVRVTGGTVDVDGFVLLAKP